MLGWWSREGMMGLFFPEYFLVAMSIRLTLNTGKGGWEKGAIINASLTSLSRSLLTVFGSKL